MYNNTKENIYKVFTHFYKIFNSYVLIYYVEILFLIFTQSSKLNYDNCSSHYTSSA